MSSVAVGAGAGAGAGAHGTQSIRMPKGRFRARTPKRSGRSHVSYQKHVYSKDGLYDKVFEEFGFQPIAYDVAATILRPHLDDERGLCEGKFGTDGVIASSRDNILLLAIDDLKTAKPFVHAFAVISPSKEKHVAVEFLCKNGRSPYIYIAAELLHYIALFAEKIKKTSIRLEPVEDVVGYYEKLGFVKVGERVVENEDYTVPIMEISIDDVFSPRSGKKKTRRNRRRRT